MPIPGRMRKTRPQTLHVRPNPAINRALQLALSPPLAVVLALTVVLQMVTTAT